MEDKDLMLIIDEEETSDSDCGYTQEDECCSHFADCPVCHPEDEDEKDINNERTQSL